MASLRWALNLRTTLFALLLLSFLCQRAAASRQDPHRSVTHAPGYVFGHIIAKDWVHLRPQEWFSIHTSQVYLMLIGSLSKHDVDRSENVIRKCHVAFLQSFFNYSKSLCLKKCLLTVLELIWNQRLRHKKTKLNICHHMLTSSTQLQNRTFHVVERTRTSTKCKKMKNACAKRAKILFFIVKYANLWGFCCRRRRGCLSSLFPFERAPRWFWSNVLLFRSSTFLPKGINQFCSYKRLGTFFNLLLSFFKRFSRLS